MELSFTHYPFSGCNARFLGFSPSKLLKIDPGKLLFVNRVMLIESVAEQVQNNNLLNGSKARSYKLYVQPVFPKNVLGLEPFSWQRLIICVLPSIYNHDNNQKIVLQERILLNICTQQIICDKGSYSTAFTCFNPMTGNDESEESSMSITTL